VVNPADRAVYISFLVDTVAEKGAEELRGDAHGREDLVNVFEARGCGVSVCEGVVDRDAVEAGGAGVVLGRFGGWERGEDVLGDGSVGRHIEYGWVEAVG